VGIRVDSKGASRESHPPPYDGRGLENLSFTRLSGLPDRFPCAGRLTPARSCVDTRRLSCHSPAAIRSTVDRGDHDARDSCGCLRQIEGGPDDCPRDSGK